MKKKTMAWGCALLMGLTLTACGADASKFTGYIEDLDMQGAYSYNITGSTAYKHILFFISSKMISESV